MAHPTYLDAAGATRSRKGSGAAGTNVDPDITYMLLEGVPAAAALANGASNPSTITLGACTLIYNGATWDRWTGAVTITSGTITTVSTVTSLSQFAGQAISLGAGAVAAGTMRITLASDDPAVASLGVMDDWDETDRCKVNIIAGQAGVTAGAGAVATNTPRVTLASDDPAVTAIGTTNTEIGATNEASAAADNSTSGLNGLLKRVLARLTALLPTALTGGGGLKVGVVDSLPAGTAAIGKLAANSGVDIGDVDVTSISAGSNVIGDVGLSGRTSGGLTIHSRLSTGASGEATNVKASAGQLFWAMITNTNASARYIKFYNSASAPTAGSGTPVLRILIPPNSSGYQLRCEQGLPFSSGIGYTVVTTAADAGSTSPAADEVIVNLGYR